MLCDSLRARLTGAACAWAASAASRVAALLLAASWLQTRRCTAAVCVPLVGGCYPRCKQAQAHAQAHAQRFEVFVLALTELYDVMCIVVLQWQKQLSDPRVCCSVTFLNMLPDGLFVHCGLVLVQGAEILNRQGARDRDQMHRQGT
jgi:hypothetical protein